MLEELGGVLIVGSVAVFVCGNPRVTWPYCLGAAVLGVVLVVVDRVTGGSSGT